MMEKTEKKVETNKVSRYQFSIEEIREMIKEPELLETIYALSKDEYNKGKAGSYLLSIAKQVKKQTTIGL